MAQSLAQRFRHAREAFELGLQLGCTPAEAIAERDRRAARERWVATERRLQAKMAAPCREALRAGHEADERPVPWWQRED